MSTPTLVRPGIRRLVESRPPAVSLDTGTPLGPASSEPSGDQPALDLREGSEVDQPGLTGVRGIAPQVSWTAPPRPDLPDAGAWGTSLVLAVVQVLLAQRPVAQLNRWLADDVLAAVNAQHRRRRLVGTGEVVPVQLRSLRVQHPLAEVAEVSAHVAVGRKPTPMALRLEAVGNRWLCVALELDPRVFR